MEIVLFAGSKFIFQRQINELFKSLMAYHLHACNEGWKICYLMVRNIA